jgi:hypothetical protein
MINKEVLEATKRFRRELEKQQNEESKPDYEPATPNDKPLTVNK